MAEKVNEEPTFTSKYFEKDRKIYVRDVYIKLYDNIRHWYDVHCRSRGVPSKGEGVWVIGTPQIGKSTFLLYVLKRIIDDINPMPLLIVTRSSKSFLYDDKRNTFDRTDLASIDDLDEADKGHRAIHLVDPTHHPEPGFVEHYGLVIFFASPTLSNVDPYHSKKLMMLYMPVWDKDEMLQAIRYLDWDPDKSLQNFNIWGGVVLSGFGSSTMESELDRILNDQRLLALLSNVQDTTLSREMTSCQWLLHRRPIVDSEGTVDFTKCTVSFPSSYVAGKIIEKLKSQPLTEPLVAMRSSPLLGNFYQSNVNKQLLIPGTQLIVQSFHQEAITKNLHIKHLSSFKNCSEIEEPANSTLYFPLESNKVGTDVVFIETSLKGWIIQITTNKSHNALNVSSTLRNFPGITDWYVCCITPEKEEFKFPVVKDKQLVLISLSKNPLKQYIFLYTLFADNY